MEKIVLFFFLLQVFVYGNIKDDLYIYKANSAIENKQNAKAYKYLQKVSNKTDTIYYNMANILSEQKNYKQAIVLYEKIKDTKLQHKVLHNMANSYVELFEYEKAISYYKKSLQLHDNPQTKSNLDLANLEYTKKIQKEKKLKKLKQKFRSGRANEGFADDLDDNMELNVTMYESKNDGNKSLVSGISKMDDTSHLGVVIDDNISDEMNDSKSDFSNYVQEKWDNQFDIKVHTLLIPLEKGNVNDSKKPW